MKKTILFLIAFLVSNIVFSQVKTISDCTIIYNVISSKAGQQNNIGSKTVYIKGKHLRVDLVSNNFSQTVFYDSNTGNATVLKNIGDSKYISTYNEADWRKENAIYDGMTVSLGSDRKKIFDYSCKQATITLKNGSTYILYYVPELVPSVMESPFQLKNIPGLVLQYESSVNGDEKLLYTAQKIEFTPVPSYRFEIPNSGYRVLN